MYPHVSFVTGPIDFFTVTFSLPEFLQVVARSYTSSAKLQRRCRYMERNPIT
jgi:hypothetical protein